MRRQLGWLLVLVGVVIALVGVAGAVLFGPDDRATTGPHAVPVAGVGLATAPGAIAYAGPRLELTIQCQPAGRRLFAGVAHHVDAVDFLARAPYTRVDEIWVPWDIATTDVRGEGELADRPRTADFWTTKAVGHGTVTLDWLLAEAPQDLVVVDAHGRPISSLAITASLVLAGGFVASLAVAALGLGLIAGGAVLASSARTAR